MNKKTNPRGVRRRAPSFLTVDAIVALHAESIAALGGDARISDVGALKTAIARCRTSWESEAVATPADHAGALGFGLAMSHAFVEGNERIALIAVAAFLECNGKELTANEPDAYSMFLGVATGKVSESGLALWITANSAPVRGIRGPDRP